MKKYELTKEFKRAYEKLDDLKMLLTCYDKKYHFEVIFRFLDLNCKDLKDVYKGFILHSIGILS